MQPLLSRPRVVASDGIRERTAARRHNRVDVAASGRPPCRSVVARVDKLALRERLSGTCVGHPISRG